MISWKNCKCCGSSGVTRKMIDSLLLIGRPTGMEEIVASVLQRSSSSRVFLQLSAALNIPEPVSWIIVLQHWPDEYEEQEIRRLLETFPLARFTVIQGPWCLSERRNRGSWPAAICVRSTQAVARLDREVEVLTGKRAPLPWTAGLDEIFAFDHGV